jgi:hypothetical protein
MQDTVRCMYTTCIYMLTGGRIYIFIDILLGCIQTEHGRLEYNEARCDALDLLRLRAVLTFWEGMAFHFYYDIACQIYMYVCMYICMYVCMCVSGCIVDMVRPRRSVRPSPSEPGQLLLFLTFSTFSCFLLPTPPLLLLLKIMRFLSFSLSLSFPLSFS